MKKQQFLQFLQERIDTASTSDSEVAYRITREKALQLDCGEDSETQVTVHCITVMQTTYEFLVFSEGIDETSIFLGIEERHPFMELNSDAIKGTAKSLGIDVGVICTTVELPFALPSFMDDYHKWMGGGFELLYNEDHLDPELLSYMISLANLHIVTNDRSLFDWAGGKFAAMRR